MIPNYVKTTWHNGSTPINETNLNKIENQLESITDEKSTATATGNSVTLGLNNEKVPDTALVIYPKENLYDNDNPNILDGMFISTNTGKYSTLSGAKCLYIECDANKTYTIHKSLRSSRFYVATSPNIPASGDSYTNVAVGTDNATTELSITSGSSDNYLCVFYFLASSDTGITEEEIRGTIYITEGPYEIEVLVDNPYTKLKLEANSYKEVILNDGIVNIINMTSDDDEIEVVYSTQDRLLNNNDLQIVNELEKRTMEELNGKLVNVGSLVDNNYRLNVIKELNLFYPNNVTNNNATCMAIADGLRVNKTITGAGFCLFKLKDVSNYEGETFTINSTFTSGGKTIIGLCDEEGGNRIAGTTQTTSDTPVSYTIPTITTSKYLAVWLYGPENATGDVDYTNIMVNPGSTAITYEPYGQSKIIADGETIYDGSLSKYAKIVEDNVTLGSLPETLGCINLGRWLEDKDINDLPVGYTCYYEANDTHLPAHAPINGCRTYCFRGYGNTGAKVQVSLRYNNDDVFIRHWWSNAWSPWINVNQGRFESGEVRIGRWIDAKPIYRKVINFGALPNNTTKNVAHGISNIGDVVKFEGVMASGNYRYPIPQTTSGGRVSIWLGGNNVSIQTTADFSSYSAKVVLEYTKSTD